jgi:hypothetical protein
VRPHDLRIDGIGVRARVSGRAFVGDELVLSLAVTNLRRPLQVHVPMHTAVRIGQELSVALSPDDVLVLPATD